MENKKRFWSKAGIVVGVILILLNIVLSSFAFNNPNIRDPHGFSDLVIIVYPNVLLGIPGVLLSLAVAELVSPSRDTQLFATLFVSLSVYWFFVGLFVTWLYRKISHPLQVMLLSFLFIVVLLSLYIGYVTVTPRSPTLPTSSFNYK